MDFYQITSPIIGTDSYKVSHHSQTPPGIGITRSYLAARGLSKRFQYLHDLAFGPDHKPEVIAFFAAQVLLPAILRRPITQFDINEAREVFADHFFGRTDLFNEKDWQRILNKHGGYLPINIRIVPEGTRVPVGNILMAMENTDDQLPWVTNYVETRLSRMWDPIAIATQSYYIRKIILNWLERNGTPEEIDFKLHDFGYRGTSGEESSAIGGLAHLTSFQGTDTLAAVMLARKFYACKMAGYSIPAAEHFTITSWGRDGEPHAYMNMLTKNPVGLVAVVSDSYDIYYACEKIWGEMLRDQVLAREGRLIIRPDSGEPIKVILKCLEILKQKFGAEVNSKGRLVLHPKVRMIWGDGIRGKDVHFILEAMDYLGWSADNIAFGMGGGLLQDVNRDDIKSAIKASEIVFQDGRVRGISKNPVTDPGKQSQAGNLTLYLDGKGRLYTADRSLRTHTDIMIPAYQDGFMTVNDPLSLVRDRLVQRETAGV
jgi:nicotinamide phosphoribosyltransferase